MSSVTRHLTLGVRYHAAIPMISGPLISATEAIELLDRVIVLDARAGAEARRDYLEGHLAGALYVDLEADLSEVGDPREGGRHPLPPLQTWAERLGGWGIGPSTPVFVYDANDGGMAAARAWWMLHAIGHPLVAVIDGGLDALREKGAPMESGPSSATSSAMSYPVAQSGWPTVDASFVDQIRSDATWRLLDARAPARYAGDDEPIDPVAGHIAGARNLHWQAQVDEHGRLADAAELRKRYADLLGDVPPERVVCYCGSGVTACHLLLAMEACGLPGARLYVGSWSEWCRTRGSAIPSE